jgi:hypothetical protein
MAKKKDKSGKKTKAPKTVAGIKLPKDLRKPLEAALHWLQSPLAREVLAAALVAAASALVTRRDDHEKAASPGRTPPGRGAVDVPGLLTQGIAAFVSGLGQTSHRSDGAPKQPADDPSRTKPTLVP